MKLGYVCTNFNNSLFTRAAIASLHAGGRGTDVHIVVVDNQSRQDDVAALRQVAAAYPNVELILQDENVGYFPGLNVGIRAMRRQHPEVEYLVVGNNDLEFPPDFLDQVDRYGQILEEWAVVAPDLVTPEGVHQNPHVLHPISRVRRTIWNVYYASYVGAAVIRRVAHLTRRLTARAENATGSELHRVAQPVEQGYGACYLLGPAFFRHFEAFSAPTFLMQEEFFLYEQLKRIGQLTYYDPRFVVGHAGHATMGKLPSRRHWSLARDAHRIYNRYRGMTTVEQNSFLAAAARPRS